MADQQIVKCVIHPGIGIARVGNSPEGFFIGPEVPGVFETPAGGYKDGQGRIKRQAAKFRIYGLNADGDVVRELSAQDPDVEELSWTVHLANKKAAWYDFDIALDIPEAAQQQSKRRNANFMAREQLVIDPGPSTIAGPEQRLPLNPGSFMGVPVQLGELRTDADGNLLVLGGRGHSASPLQQPCTTFANNEYWFDDTSDGSVCAVVRINGQEVDVEPAWVVVAPPDYAPGILGVVTLYDVMFQVALEIDPSLEPVEVSFTEQILPIFERFVQTQWVNQGFYLDWGWESPEDFLAPDNLSRLADNSIEARPFREAVFAQFRNPNAQTMRYDALPPMYGDSMGIPATTVNAWLAVTAVQYDWLEKWMKGDFIADWDPCLPPGAQCLAELPVELRPQALDRAALEACLGGAFHPGCEMTWPMRHASMYSAPFRIKHRPADLPEPDYGAVLTQQIALSPVGPLTGGSRPGDINRWMAVPWQADTSSCRSGYEPSINPYLPTFWPARVPNHVLAEGAYEQVMNPTLSLGQRLKYFNLRHNWLQDFPNGTVGINGFVQSWSKIGIVVRQPGPGDTVLFPPEIHVEMGNSLDEE
jgi:hypothetical protein